MASTQLLFYERTHGPKPIFLPAMAWVGINPAPTAIDPWPKLSKLIFLCWPDTCDINPAPSSNDPMAETDFLLASLVARGTLHLQTALGLNTRLFYAGPTLVASTQLHPETTLWPKPIFLPARLAASTPLHLQTTLDRNRFFAGPPRSVGPTTFG